MTQTISTLYFKKIISLLVFLTAIIAGFSFLTSLTHAVEIDTSYDPLVKIEGVTDAQTTDADIGSYVSGAYKWTISLAIALAVIMFTFYAFQYLLSESTITSKAHAKEGMKNVIIGLLLIFAAYLVLQTINPQLVAFNLTLDLPEATSVSESDNGCAGADIKPTGVGVYYITNIECRKAIPGSDQFVTTQATRYNVYSGSINRCQQDVRDGNLGNNVVGCVIYSSNWIIRQRIQLTASQEGGADYSESTYYPSDLSKGWSTEGECQAQIPNYGKTDIPAYCAEERAGEWEFFGCSVIKECHRYDGNITTE